MTQTGLSDLSDLSEMPVELLIELWTPIASEILSATLTDLMMPVSELLFDRLDRLDRLDRRPC